MRLRRLILAAIVLLPLTWLALFGVEYFVFASERRLADWTWAEPDAASELAAPQSPRYEPSTATRQILFVEHDLLAPEATALDHRRRDLTRQLRRSPNAIRADLILVPRATTVRTALWLADGAGPAVFVVTISARDVVWNDRDVIGGVRQPRLREHEASVIASVVKPSPEAPGGLERVFRDVPTLRFLIHQSRTLPTREGLFPDDLWPFRRNGVADETKRYESTRLALRLLKATVSRRGGHLAILYVPCALEVGRASRGLCHEALSLTSREIESARVRRHLADMTNGLGIAWVDPVQALEKASRNRGPLFDGAASLRARLTNRARRIMMGQLANTLIPMLAR